MVKSKVELLNPQLEKLYAKRKQLDARIEKSQAIERTKRRKEDTRRKIIVGAIAIENMELNPNSGFTDELMALLDKHVTRAKDRELVGLRPISVANDFSKIKTG